MIPAILSCVFVIYLYQTLNHVDNAADPVSNPNRHSPVTAESLSARMEQIQERLENLAKGSGS